MSQLMPDSRTQLRQALAEHFSLDELDTLCYDLGVDYESVPGYGRDKETRAREVVTYFEDRERLADLVAQCAKERPLVQWSDLLRFVPDEPPSALASAAPQGGDPPILVPPVAPEGAAPPTPPTALNVTRTAAHSVKPRLLVDGAGVLHLIWLDDTLRQGSPDLFKYDVLHRQRPPHGQWSEVTNLSEGFRSVTDYHLDLLRNPAGEPCAIWQGDPNHEDVEGFFMRCLSGGQWSPAKLVEKGSFGVGMAAAFAPDGTLVSILSRAPDYEPRWGDTDLSDGLKAASDIQLAIDTAGTYHLVWVRLGEPYSLEYRSSTDDGATWSSAVRLSADDTIPTNGWVRLVADTTGAVHLVYGGSSASSYYRRWTPQGGWEATLDLGRFRLPAGMEGLVADSAGRPHGVWWTGLSEIVYAYQQPGGAWASRLIAPSGAEPVLALDDQRQAHIAWEVQDDARDIYYASVS